MAWIFGILTLVVIYVFWVLPYQLGPQPVEVIFVEDGG